MWIQNDCPNEHTFTLHVESEDEVTDKEIRCPVCGEVAYVKGDPGPFSVEPMA